MRLNTLRTAVAALTIVLTGGALRPASAQSSGDGYRFRAPEARLTLRGGYALPQASSDLFDFTFEQLTLKRTDLGSFTLGAELAIPVSDRWELGADVSYMRAHKNSSFRHYVDNNDREIEQSTTFERFPLMLNARYLLAPAGRSIGKLAWIPTHIVPWVGGGGGAMYYRFNQKGDFVNYQNFNVFADQLSSDAWAPALQGIGGFDLTLTPTLAITTEARYIWSKGDVRSDYQGFNKIDLSGASATVGLTIRM